MKDGGSNPADSLPGQDPALTEPDALGLLENLDGWIRGPHRLFPLLVGLFSICWLFANAPHHEKSITVLLSGESVVLSVMAAFSTWNYLRTRDRLNEFGVSQTRCFRVNVMMAANMILFVLVAVFHEPIQRLCLIVLIYAAFAHTNIIQVRRAEKYIGKEIDQIVATLEAGTVLNEENGPTMIAYTATVVLVVVHACLFPAAFAFLEVFVGGVAAFHLGVSVVKYWMVIRKDDPTEVALRAAEWKPTTARGVIRGIMDRNQWWGKGVFACTIIMALVLGFQAYRPIDHTDVHETNIGGDSTHATVGTPDDNAGAKGRTAEAVEEEPQ